VCLSLSSSNSQLCLLLGGGLGLCGLLLVAPDHDHADKGAHDGGPQEEEDDWDSDGPDTGEEEVLKGVVVVDKGHEDGPDRVVEEDNGGGHEHGESDEFVEHCWDGWMDE